MEKKCWLLLAASLVNVTGSNQQKCIKSADLWNMAQKIVLHWKNLWHILNANGQKLWTLNCALCLIPCSRYPLAWISLDKGQCLLNLWTKIAEFFVVCLLVVYNFVWRTLQRKPDESDSLLRMWVVETVLWDLCRSYKLTCQIHHALRLSKLKLLFYLHG